ncbi:hypothetical protein CSPX01_11502 [Colletotrichum filicis]|nr:hypothetical protein CSPX01_11502 [Colletotrichum filicis]
MTVKSQVWNQAPRISLPKYPERRTMYPSASYLYSSSEDQVSPEWQSQNMTGLAHGDEQYLTATLLCPRSRAPLQRPEPQGQARACPRHDDPNPRGSPNLPREPLSVSAWHPGCSMRLPPPPTPHSCPPHPERSPPPYTDLTRPQLKVRHLTLPKLRESRATSSHLSYTSHLTHPLTHSPTYSHTSLTNTSSHST